MPDDTQIDLRQTIAGLRRELEVRTAERDDALARQSATSEILSVISRSPSDIRPVLEATLAHAAQLCEAELNSVFRFEDGPSQSSGGLTGRLPGFANPAARGQSASPAARCRPDNKSSRCRAFRRKLASDISAGVMARSRAIIARASASRPICA
jgi:hypothetical protein